ncbi:MAG: AAA family ATPase [Firmicutes bacterium]|jgi:lon-related putative ATP-dependent protease|nr:AAA family ATPase [Bacillota bacterium]
MTGKKGLQPDKLCKKCDAALFEFETTEEIIPLEGIIGQERAVKAVEFGLGIKRHGYNIFITGLTGTGKTSYAQTVAREKAANERVPDDWCYLYNFKNPGEPMALNLPAGMGKIFVADIDNLLEELREEIPKAFNTEEYERQKGNILKEFQETRSALMEKLNLVAQENGFLLKRTGSGFLSVPLRDGQEMSEEEYSRLEQPEREILEKKSTEIQLKALEISRLIQNEEKKLKKLIKELEQKTGLQAVGHLIDEINEKYRDYPKVINYLEELKEDILANLNDFKEEEDDKQLPFLWVKQSTTTTKYNVNLLIDNSESRGAPVVVENNPTYYNLIGRLEHENRLGMVTTDFTMIKAGALHRANGGYLILQAKDVLLNPQSWEVLKRVLKTKEIRIETIGEQYALLSMTTLKPEPIPLDVKVILIGSPLLYHLLYRYDEDFKKLFKIKSDFDGVMDLSVENMTKMANFISANCRSEGLTHFDRSGVARVVDYSARLAEHQEKLTTRFNEIVEILYEADAWAALENSPYVRAEHVDRAVREKNYRSGKYEKKLLEMVEEGQLLLDFQGEKVGQINGLAVIDLGDYTFGRPSRITVSTYLGRRGIVNIERESRMSGRIHDKGVLIISGYLGEKYAQSIPLTLSASICFEQSYDGVDGDSASSAELYALLSSLSEVPLRQGIAVTGSVNQKGEIQPVGGITWKIEGFFKACKLQGLSGDQGVIIPHQNIINLMLDEEVVEAVREGKFHIYAVKTVEEGMEILTGMPAGERGEDGKYPAGTINYLVEQKLKLYYEMLGRQGREQEKAGEQKGESAPQENEDTPQEDEDNSQEDGKMMTIRKKGPNKD